MIEQDLGKDAAGKTLELGKALNDAQRTALEKNARDLFDLGMRGFDKTVDFLGLARGVVTVLRVFGVDTTDFIQRCDDEMAAARASVPEISTATIARAPTTVAAGGNCDCLGCDGWGFERHAGNGSGPKYSASRDPQILSQLQRVQRLQVLLLRRLLRRRRRSGRFLSRTLNRPFSTLQNPIQGLSAQEADALLKNAAAKDGKQGRFVHE